MKYLALPLLLMLLFFSGCDLLDDDDDDSSDGDTEVVATNDTSSSTTPTTSTPTTASSKVVLNASSDFSCTSNWTTRDGAWGLKARSKKGSCQASFPGESGNYRVVITVQTEFDGNSPYLLYINGNTAASGKYPL
ncbi:MAG: hypothetical protein D3908_13025, partial [Candidatus Electrothrix sp. AUS4]|nr:hypothetical protein [Candidatus Electrothrix sp. AUS4]